LKCEYCGGAIVYRAGSWGEPDRLVCMACGREPKGEEKKMEKRNCILCGQVFEAKREGTTVCCKKCRNIKYKSSRPKRNSEKSRKIRRKKAIQNPGPTRIPSMNLANLTPSRIDMAQIEDTILLDQQILKAIKKSVANQIIRIIEEAFA